MVADSRLAPHNYEFRVAEELGRDWYEWLDGFEVEASGGVTVIRGCVVDQSALYGIIARLAGLGLTLLSVDCRDTESLSWRRNTQ